jgi:nitrite reductase/ring-hydroxylating ferredoxin subunit
MLLDINGKGNEFFQTGDSTMADFKRAIAYSELEEGKITAVNIEGQRIALYRIAGEVLATCEVCTHEDCSLEDFGKIYGQEVECTCHGAQFNIRTGAVTKPPATVPLKTYKVEIKDEEVYVEI